MVNWKFSALAIVIGLEKAPTGLICLYCSFKSTYNQNKDSSCSTNKKEVKTTLSRHLQFSQKISTQIGFTTIFSQVVTVPKPALRHNQDLKQPEETNVKSLTSIVYHTHESTCVILQAKSNSSSHEETLTQLKPVDTALFRPLLSQYSLPL